MRTENFYAARTIKQNKNKAKSTFAHVCMYIHVSIYVHRYEYLNIQQQQARTYIFTQYNTHIKKQQQQQNTKNQNP